MQPLYSSRPVWTTGDGWYAIGHGDSTEVVVRANEGHEMLRIRMPRRRRAVTEEDRIEAADWRTAGFALTRSSYRERVREGRVEDRRRAREEVLGEVLIHNADSVPRVRGAYGAGRCLFLSGFRPADWYDGTSLTWVVIDVEEAVVLGTVRLRPPPDGSLPEFPEFSQFGAAARDFDEEYAFTFRRMADGAAAVERFRLPFDCRS